MNKSSLLIALVVLIASASWTRPSDEASARQPLVNFHYIESQRDEVRIGNTGTHRDSELHLIWRVDADALAQRTFWHDVGPPAPPLRGRSDLISTDDIAWVTLVYLREVEHNHEDSRARVEARRGLRTLAALQRPDGSFVAYQTNLTPGEKQAPAMYDSSDWMAASRAIQAMGAGIRVFDATDATTTRSLEHSLQRTLQRMQATWGRPEHRVGQHYVIDQMHLPAWLPYNRADAAAAILLGLADWAATRHAQAPLPVIRAFADALIESQKGGPAQYPWNAFLPQSDKPSLWYADGNLQAAALIRAHDVLSRTTCLSAPLLEAELLYPQILTSYDMPWQMTPRPEPLPIVPGAAASLVMNECALYRATGKDRHALLAALLASSLTTPRGKQGPMYDAATGRCADLLTATGLSHTSSPGASARVLYALLEVEDTPGIRELGAVSLAQGPAPTVLQAVDGKPVTVPIFVQEVDLPGGSRRLARVAHDNAFWLKFDVGTQQCYRIDMVYVKDRTSGAVVNVRLDGEEILSIPLGGLNDGDIFPTRQNAVGPTRLDPGLHTLGVRGNGLLLSGGSLLDSFVVQPVVGWRLWRVPDGRRMAMFASCSERAEIVDLPPSAALPPRERRSVLWQAGTDLKAAPRGESIEASRMPDGTWRVKVPAYGSGIVEW